MKQMCSLGNAECFSAGNTFSMHVICSWLLPVNDLKNKIKKMKKSTCILENSVVYYHRCDADVAQ